MIKCQQGQWSRLSFLTKKYKYVYYIGLYSTDHSKKTDVQELPPQLMSRNACSLANVKSNKTKSNVIAHQVFQPSFC